MAPKKGKKRDDDFPDEVEEEKVVKGSKGKKGKAQTEEKVAPAKKSKKGESDIKIDLIANFLIKNAFW